VEKVKQGMNWKNLLESASESVNDHLRLRNAYLRAENRILRQQINGRMQLTDSERKELAVIGVQLSRQALEEIATVATPDTIFAWHRKFAGQQGNSSTPRQPVGRPRTDKEIEDLVVRMARENRSWGYDRIQGALQHLGYTISDQTVGNILKRQGMAPAPERKKTVTWREFIRVHVAVLLATDFFTHEGWSGLELLISSMRCFLCHSRHKVSAAGMTLHHKEQWRLPLLRGLHDLQIPMQWWATLGKAARSRPIRFGADVLRLPRFDCVPSEFRVSYPRGIGKVVLMSVGNPRPIRDGPMRCPHPLGRLLKDDHREAA
jgi:putative transposase